MRLEVGTFHVQDVVFGSATRLNGDVLEINKNELLDMVKADPYVAQADIEIARPGESVRIIEYENVIEPKLKVEGGGTPYPGVCGRSTDTVGAGRTYRMNGVAVVECLDISGLPEASEGDPVLLRRHRSPPDASHGLNLLDEGEGGDGLELPPRRRDAHTVEPPARGAQ